MLLCAFSLKIELLKNMKNGNLVVHGCSLAFKAVKLSEDFKASGLKASGAQRLKAPGAEGLKASGTERLKAFGADRLKACWSSS